MRGETVMTRSGSVWLRKLESMWISGRGVSERDGRISAHNKRAEFNNPVLCPDRSKCVKRISFSANFALHQGRLEVSSCESQGSIALPRSGSTQKLLAHLSASLVRFVTRRPACWKRGEVTEGVLLPKYSHCSCVAVLPPLCRTLTRAMRTAGIRCNCRP